MKVSHQLRDKSVEKEVSSGASLGFILSNKAGSLFYYDAKNDCTQFYARIGQSTYKIIDNIELEGKVHSVNNKFCSVETVRNDHSNRVFVPYYMNAISIQQKADTPFCLSLDIKDIQAGFKFNKNILTEKQGRLVIKSQEPVTGRVLFTVIQGDDLKYDHAKSNDISSGVDIMSARVVIASAETEDKALSVADHLYHNEDQIRSLQEKCVASNPMFYDAESSLAYSCVMNVTDNMFFTKVEGEEGLMPLPVFSEVNNPHTTIATTALLSDGEFGVVKKALLDELNDQYSRLNSTGSSLEEVAWPIILFGKMLNKLCTDKQLYRYFSPEEIKTLALQTAVITDAVKKKYSESGVAENDIEKQALLLASQDLAFALTKSDAYRDTVMRLKDETKQNLLVNHIQNIEDRRKVDMEDAKAIFLTAYLYPLLMDKSEWKECMDKVMHGMHNDFRTMRNKLSSEFSGKALDIELFGLSSLAAVVLHRLDPIRYATHIKGIHRRNVSDVLYKGIIGRPTSEYNHDVQPETEAIIGNTHLLNNTLFLEMLNECV